MKSSLDPRTKLVIGALSLGAVLIADKPETHIATLVVLAALIPLSGLWGKWARSFKLFGSMVLLVFVITFLSFGAITAAWLSVRLVNLMTVSFLFFNWLSPEQMGAGLRRFGAPHEPVFVLTAAMRYVPLIGRKIRSIMDAQISRGIDLRPRLKNAGRYLALLMPLLAQSFVLSEDLAVAMESRGFGRKDRTVRGNTRMRPAELLLIAATILAASLYVWWEKG